MIREYTIRGFQILLGSFIFDLPGFASFKTAFLRLFFSIGQNTYISYHTLFVSPHTRQNAYLRLGNNVGIEHSCFIDYSGGLSIDDNVWVSEGVFIATHGHRIDTRRPKREHPVVHTPLHIGEDAWIGASVIILDKVTRVGQGAIIGAGSVVTRDVDDWAIVAGNPARVIGQRQSGSSALDG